MAIMPSGSALLQLGPSGPASQTKLLGRGSGATLPRAAAALLLLGLQGHLPHPPQVVRGKERPGVDGWWHLSSAHTPCSHSGDGSRYLSVNRASSTVLHRRSMVQGPLSGELHLVKGESQLPRPPHGDF